MEAGRELVGAGEGGGGVAIDLSAKHRPNIPTTTIAKHVPTAFFIALQNVASLIPCKK
jgi:hypothetical protein